MSSGDNVRPTTLTLIERTVRELGRSATTAELVETSGFSEQTVRNAMRANGWVLGRDMISRRQVWIRDPDVEFDEPTPEPQPNPLAATPLEPALPRAGSWIVPPTEALQAIADAMGVEVEVRVWREG